VALMFIQVERKKKLFCIKMSLVLGKEKAFGFKGDWKCGILWTKFASFAFIKDTLLTLSNTFNLFQLFYSEYAFKTLDT
jgi:hypothetical protein